MRARSRVTIGVVMSADSSYWKSHSGGLTVSIGWGSSANNFNLYVYSGHSLVASSTSANSKSESVYFKNPQGSYEVRVVPFLVVSSGYSGGASFSSKANPPPPHSPPPPTTPPPSHRPPPPTTPPPTTPPGGGGGGGSGGGGSGGGSGYGGGGYGGGSYGSGYGGYSGYGGGSASFQPATTTTSRHVYYQTSDGVTQRAGGSGSQPVAGNYPRVPGYLWVLVPIGLLLVMAAAGAIFERDREPVRVASSAAGGPSRVDLRAVPILALGGLMVQTVALAARGIGAGGRALARGVGRIAGRPKQPPSADA
jgi:hypothetical protein